MSVREVRVGGDRSGDKKELGRGKEGGEMIRVLREREVRHMSVREVRVRGDRNVQREAKITQKL